MNKVIAIPINDPKSPPFIMDGAPLKHNILMKTDLIENNNKYFSIELQKSTKNTYRVYTNYGRVGSSGAQDGRYFDDQYAAEREYDGIVKKKLSKTKGYIKVDIAKSAVGSSQAQQTITVTELPKNKKIAAKVATSVKTDPAIHSFISQVYEDASSALTTSYNVTINKDGVQTPLGALSQKQIDKGRMLLDEIRRFTKRGSVIGTAAETKLIQLSGQYFSNIPRRLPARPDPRVIAILETKKADDEEELLNLMQDVFDMKGEMVSDIDNKYAALKTKIEPISVSNAEWDRITKYIKGTESRHHNVSIQINGIYQLKLDADHSRFNPKTITPVKELFHGSRNANIMGILTKGLLIAPKNVPSTGYMFGKGIYFADQSTKSTQYSNGRYTYGNGSRDNAFLFLADVAVGKMRKFDCSHYQDEAPSGYDSVMGVAGRQLLHNEYIVYNVNQARIKYIVDFTTRHR